MDRMCSKWKLTIGLLAVALACAGCATPALWGKKKHQATTEPTFAFSPETGQVLVRYSEGTFGLTSTNAETTQPRAFWLNLTNNTKLPSFVDVTNTTNWVDVPQVEIDVLSPTNRQDIKWLWEHPKKSKGASTNAPAHRTICVGINTAGQVQFISDVPPQGQFYCRLKTPSPRYMGVTRTVPEHGYAVVCYEDSLFLWCDGKEQGRFQLPSYNTYGRANTVRVLLTPFAATADAAVGAVVVPVVVSGVVCYAVIVGSNGEALRFLVR